MKLRMTVFAALALAGFTALPSSAQSMKPGLWEINNKMQSGNGKLEQAMTERQKDMASLAPEQRKMMAEMMARQGVNLAAGPGGGMVVKMCLTPEMVARHEVPIQRTGDCTTSYAPAAANTIAVSFSCANPPSSGEGVVTYSGQTAYTMKMKVSSAVHGRPETVNMASAAKWLAADCGAIRPPAVPAQK